MDGYTYECLVSGYIAYCSVTIFFYITDHFL